MKKGYFKLDHSYKGRFFINGTRECCMCMKSFPIKYEFTIVIERKEFTICEECLLGNDFENSHSIMVKNPNNEWYNLREM